MAAYTAEHGPLPTTVEATTGSGGTHYLFAHHEGVRNATGLLEGVDVRGDGGLIVAAPSGHKSGGSYEWVNKPVATPLAEWPPALLALMAARTHKDAATMHGATMDSTPTVVSNVEAYVAGALQNMAKTVAATPSGQRHDALLKAATSVGRLMEYIGKDRATAELTGAVEAWGAGVNGADTQTIADGLAYGSAHPKQLAVEGAASGATVGGATAHESKTLFTIESIKDFEHVPPQKDIVEGMLQEDSLAIVYGASSAYKSFAMFGLAFAMCHGMSWYGRKVEQGNVLYIAAEGGRGLYLRARALAQFHDVDIPDNLSIIGKSVYFGEAAYLNLLCEKLEAMPVEQRPQLIIIDTLARNIGALNENDATDMGQFTMALDRVRHITGGCVLAVHHENKGGGMRGSMKLINDYDTVIKMTRQEAGIRNHTLMTCVKVRDRPEFDPMLLGVTRVELDPFTSSLVLEHVTEYNIEPFKATESKKAKLLTILQGGPLTSSEWRARALATLDMADRTAIRYIQALKTEGVVEQQGARGPYALVAPQANMQPVARLVASD